MLKNAKPFCSSNHGKNAFTSDQEVYGNQNYLQVYIILKKDYNLFFIIEKNEKVELLWNDSPLSFSTK